MVSKPSAWRCGILFAGLLLVLLIPTSSLLAGPSPSKGRLWFERSTGGVGDRLSAIAIAPDDPSTIYVAGRGVIAKTRNAAVTWRPSLILFGRSFDRFQEDGVLEINPEDIERFDDAEALDLFEDQRELLLEALTEQYGEDNAEQMLIDMDDELRAEAVEDLLNEMSTAKSGQDYRVKYDRFLEAGFSAAEARSMAGGAKKVWQLEVDPSNPDALYAATGAGLMRSQDRGRRWIDLKISLGDEGRSALSLAVRPGGELLLVGTDAGVRVSRDAGRSWGSPAGALSSQPVRIVKESGSSLYALTRNILYRSDDEGTTWKKLRPTGFSLKEVSYFLALPGEKGDLILASTPRGIQRSADSGETWTRAATRGLEGTQIHQLVAPQRDASSLFAVSNRGVFHSEDGGMNWKSFNKGWSGGEMIAVAASTDLNAVWALGEHGLFQSLPSNKGAVKEENLRRLEARWSAEPSAAETVTAALISANLETLPRDVWLARMRWSRLAPRIRFNYRYRGYRREGEVLDRLPPLGQDNTLNNDFISRQTRGVDLAVPDTQWNVMAMWDLGGLIMSREEFTIESANRQARTTRKRIIRKVMRLYLKRRALQLRVALRPRPKAARTLRDRLKLEEYTALLNGFTRGYFAAAILKDSSQANAASARASKVAASPRLP